MSVRLDGSKVQISGDLPRWVLGKAPVMSVRLVQTSGVTAVDASGNGHDGTYQNGVTLGVAGPLASGSMAAQFDVAGTTGDMSVLIPHHADLNFAVGADFTIAAWFKTGVAATQTIIEKRQTSAGAVPYLLLVGATGAVTFQRRNATLNTGTVTGPTGYADGAWHRAIAVVDGGTMALYVDGQAVGTPATEPSGTVTNTGDVRIGTRYNPDLGTTANRFRDAIAEVSVFDYAFTADDAAADFAAATWQDISADVVATSVKWKRGINGSGPRDRVAQSGELSFDLRNDVGNSGGLLGYYSPDHVNCRAGFTTNIPCRLLLTYGAADYPAFTGRVASIAPTPGRRGPRRVTVKVTDWIDYAAGQRARAAELQVDKRVDEILTHLVGLVPVAPFATSFAEGIDTFSYALDRRGETGSILEECAKAVDSDLGYFYVTADGTVTLDNRHDRLRRASSVTLADVMSGLDAARDRSRVLNRIAVTVHPRRVDAAATTVLYNHDTVIDLQVGATITVDAQYRDPNQQAIEVGGRDVTSEAGVDMVANAAADGSGADQTDSVDTTGTFFGANAARFVLRNSVGAVIYITTLRCTGKGIYDYSPLTAINEDLDSQANDGLNELEVDMPYQSSAVNAQLAADWFASLYGAGLTAVTKMPFDPCADAALMTQAVTREIGDRLTVQEAVTGVSHEYFINAIEGALIHGKALRMSYTLSPASNDDGLWILDDTDRSVLDASTKLGWL